MKLIRLLTVFVILTLILPALIPSAYSASGDYEDYWGRTLINSGDSALLTPNDLSLKTKELVRVNQGSTYSYSHVTASDYFEYQFTVINELEETSGSTEVYDDDETFWTGGSGVGGGSIATPTLSEETSTVQRASSSLKVVVGAGSNQYWYFYHDYGAGTWYLDRTVVDVGSWVKPEIQVPNGLLDASTGIRLYAYDGASYQEFWRFNPNNLNEASWVSSSVWRCLEGGGIGKQSTR